VQTDLIGFNQFLGPLSIASTVNPLLDLPINTWYLEYDVGNNQMLFHYHLSSSVPEPGTFGLLALGAVFLRLTRRRAAERKKA
jgi:hypothetical protein